VPVPETFRSGVSERQVKSYAEFATIYLNKALGMPQAPSELVSCCSPAWKLTGCATGRLHQPGDYRQGGRALGAGPRLALAASSGCSPVCDAPAQWGYCAAGGAGAVPGRQGRQLVHIPGAAVHRCGRVRGLRLCAQDPERLPSELACVCKWCGAQEWRAGVLERAASHLVAPRMC